MGRKLMRVPLTFDWPQGKIWPGYMVSFADVLKNYYGKLSDEERKQLERHFARLMGCEIVDEGKGEMEYVEWTFLEPPTGEGYQLWETTSEGSPKSPVFATLDELCAWCEENATTHASSRTTASEWKRMLNKGLVYHQEGQNIFI